MIERWGFAPPLLITSGLYVAASCIYYLFFRNEEIHAGRPAIGAVPPGDE
jgi:hypothetical protein